MPHIGLRELKIHLSEVAKNVQDNRARYTITNRGEPVALLVPYTRAEERASEDPATAWVELVGLLHEAGHTATSNESTEQTMKWLRRY
jgi:prevent-host-death family protein